MRSARRWYWFCTSPQVDFACSSSVGIVLIAPQAERAIPSAPARSPTLARVKIDVAIMSSPHVSGRVRTKPVHHIGGAPVGREHGKEHMSNPPVVDDKRQPLQERQAGGLKRRQPRGAGQLQHLVREDRER